MPALAADIDVDAVCVKVGEASFPPGDRPTATEAKALQGCESEPLYYGIGVPADPVKARKCAFVERDAGDESIFGGSAVLIMVYANAKSVPRNLDIALALACSLESAPAERKGRVAHLLRMKGNRSAAELDLCDDITSGFMAGACAGHREKMRAVVRAGRRAAIAAKLPADAKAELAKLEQAAAVFFGARVKNEVDLSGTARSALQWEEQASLEEGFAAALERLQAKELPPAATAVQLAAADAALNAVYARVMKADQPGWGTVTREGIRETQRKWIPYRDAWVGFGGKVRPEVPADAWKAWATRERAEMLARFVRQ